MSDAILQVAPVAHGSAAMHPVSIGGCFGWLHTPPVEVTLRQAVLLCAGLRDDALTAHSHFRLLGNLLAANGYPTLRFDYPGTGDSRDLTAPSDLWTAWADSAQDAADWLRRFTGADQLILCGLRLGATLVADVARVRTDVAGLMLIAPLARGRTFVRQLEVETRLSGKAPAAGLMLNGAPFSLSSQQRIASLELQQMTPPSGCRTAIFGATPGPVMARCTLAWKDAGIIVDEPHFPGLDVMLRSRVMSHEDVADFAPLVDWLGRVVMQHTSAQIMLPPPMAITQPGWRETALRFGPANGLFGMLCQPAGQVGDRVVLILNSGGDPHYGQDRSAVDMARRLAATGLSSLRMDFAGLGDSFTPGDHRTHVFETDRRPEISAALDALASLGFRDFALYGLCSGAYHAFQAALVEPRIGHLILINLPFLQWQPGTKIESFALTQRNLAVRVSKLGDSLTWARLFSGRLYIQSRLLAWTNRTLVHLLDRLRRLGRRHDAQTQIDSPQNDWFRLSSQTQTLLLMSPIEVGLAKLEQALGPSRAAPGMTLHVMPEIDHSLTTVDMRELTTDMIIDFLDVGGSSRIRNRTS